MALKKLAVAGDVITIGKRKLWYETMSYSELLMERNFNRAERERTQKMADIAIMSDPRGMWTETMDLHKILDDRLECCDWVEGLLGGQMIKLLKEENKKT